MHGMRVVHSSTALGVTFSNVAVAHGAGAAPRFAAVAPPGADWPELLGRVTSAYRKVQRLGLSMFGRAFACAGYGISKVLYHAEHAGMPPADVLHQLQQHTRLTVDCNRLLGVRGTQPPGPAVELLVGHPRYGGFGMLPWREHIRARHAVWGCKLIWASRLPPDQQPPWARVVINCMRELGPSNPTVLPHPFSLLAGPDLWAARGAVPSKVKAGLDALPPVLDLSPDPLPAPGDWCYAAPLWGNPTLTKARQAAGLGDAALEDLLTAAHRLELADRTPKLRTVGDVVAQILRPGYVHWMPLARYLHEALPPSWVASARVAAERLQTLPVEDLPRSQPQPHLAMAVLLPRLGWLSPITGQPVPLAALSVKEATAMQLQPVRASFETRHRDFAAAALGIASPAAVPAAAIAQVDKLKEDLWRLNWENEHKEAFWRASVNGLPRFNAGCPCGALHADRQHVLWECPVAQHLVREIAAQLPQQTDLQRSHLWLMRPPSGVPVGVWRVVCLAALSAMVHGQRQLHRLLKHRTQAERDVRLRQQQHQRERQRYDRVWAQVGVVVLPPPDPAAPADVLSAEARQQLVASGGGLSVAFFWERLVDFAQLDRSPGDGELGADSPFLHTVGGHLRARRPAPPA
jgi:hypothetical protein